MPQTGYPRDDSWTMGHVYKDSVEKRRSAWRDVDVVEWAMLLAFFLVGVTALLGKIHQMMN